MASPPATAPPETHSPTPQQSNRTRKSRVSVSRENFSNVTKHKGPKKRESPSPTPRPRKVALSESEGEGGEWLGQILGEDARTEAEAENGSVHLTLAPRPLHKASDPGVPCEEP
ncbi:serine/arginine repetitive matrix protein 1-like [Tupaia chinensis]|uniref:serine/arginine repetitive matrix protein 1-like n=1 Tax=Tupaia chinensis TaxID=246437 RepID=UPI000704153D|nr:serine/arginine repetitive matrix protein 1-like [Tupaia chinensis]